MRLAIKLYESMLPMPLWFSQTDLVVIQKSSFLLPVAWRLLSLMFITIISFRRFSITWPWNKTLIFFKQIVQLSCKPSQQQMDRWLLLVHIYNLKTHSRMMKLWTNLWLCRGMGGWVASKRSYKTRLPEIFEGSTRGVGTCELWLGLLVAKKCEQPLEYGLDDQKWLY